MRPADLAQLLDLVRDGIVSHTAAKRVFARDGRDRRPAGADRASAKDCCRCATTTQLARWVDEVLAEHPEEAERFRAGEKKLLGVLVGLVMKKSKGRADPQGASISCCRRERGGRVERRAELARRSRSGESGIPNCRVASSRHSKLASPTGAQRAAPASPAAAPHRPHGSSVIRLGAIHAPQQVDDEVVRALHVARHVGVGAGPTGCSPASS